MKKSTLTAFPGAFSLLVKNTRFKTCSCIAMVFLAGCAALDTHQAKLDQKQLRDVLMDYTDEQILDNLIRASNGLPIVHFDLTNITGLVTSKFIPTVGGSRMVTSVRTKTPTNTTVTTDQTTSVPGGGQTIVNTVAKTLSVVGGVVETIAKPFNWGISAERDNAISVQADPLIDDPKVYAAYITFLNTDIVAVDSQNRPSCTPANEQNDTKVTKTTTTTTKATTIKASAAAREPTGTASPAQTPTASAATPTETKESETSSVTEEKTPKAKPPLPVGLAIKSFNSIKSLRKSPAAPPTADVLVGPKLWKDRMYYWVPKHYQRQFFALCMATVARGVPSDAATEKESDAAKALKENSAILRRQELK